MKHVVGTANPAMASNGFSHVAGILLTLANQLKLVAPPVKLFGPSFGQLVFGAAADKELEWGANSRSRKPDGSDSLPEIWMLHESLTAPPQKVEFLAKRLLYTAPIEGQKKAGLLATPLYVALSE